MFVARFFPRRTATLSHRHTSLPRISHRHITNVSHVNRLTVFNNGYGLVSEDISLPHNRTVVEIQAPAKALYGTLWVQPSEEIRAAKQQATDLLGT